MPVSYVKVPDYEQPYAAGAPNLAPKPDWKVLDEAKNVHATRR